jgi:alpha-L-fucosidase
MSVIFLIVLFATQVVNDDSAPPTPYGATPNERQLEWHDREFYGFVHFTTNTFTDKEWGYGDESPDVFNPTDFDADQIVQVAKKSGMNGLILTCKHHDGFCLWPSQYTDHSVKQSQWRGGKGDVVGEISRACARHGLAFGVYLSPWDRHQAFYGKPEYITYYRNQLTELLTNYGRVFEVWLDGANGGDGYYGGARETRRIDRSQYYDWKPTFELIRKLQPSAVIFSDAGSDVRWIGNERGIAGDPCWATFTPVAKKGEAVAGPGTTENNAQPRGDRDGEFWIPAEADVSIRPGWFYHAGQDARVRSGKNLVDLYFKSVGRGTSFLLNLPPDRRGRIHPTDEASLVEFRRILDETFDQNLLLQAKLSCSNERGKKFDASKLLDGDKATYWATTDEVVEAEVIASFAAPTKFNVVDIRECLPLGQRVHHWTLSYWTGSEWKELATGESIGSRRLWHGATAETTKVKLSLAGPVCPAISEFGIYLGPIESQE